MSRRKKRLIGGEASAVNAWPFSAFIHFKYVATNVTLSNGEILHNTSFETSCGGTLIGKRTVLSAAHCFIFSLRYSDGLNSTKEIVLDKSTTLASYKVYLGASYLDESDLDLEKISSSSITKRNVIKITLV